MHPDSNAQAAAHWHLELHPDSLWIEMQCKGLLLKTPNKVIVGM